MIVFVDLLNFMVKSIELLLLSHFCNVDEVPSLGVLDEEGVWSNASELKLIGIVR